MTTSRLPLTMILALAACGGGGSAPDAQVGDDVDARELDAAVAPLTITPRGLVLEVVDGVVVPVDFTATAGGVDVTDEVTWSYDAPAVADVPTPGHFVPTGTAGGLATLHATLGGASDSTPVTVRLRRTVDPGGLADTFPTAPSATGSPEIVYPFDGTIFPSNVVAPEVQWQRGGGSARITFIERYETVTAYVTLSGPGRFLLGDGAWTELIATSEGLDSDPLVIIVEHAENNEVMAPRAIVVHLADEPLPGRIYYEAYASSCGTSNPAVKWMSVDSTVEHTPYPSAECISCHSSGGDGAKMVAAWDSTGFGLGVLDLTEDPATLELDSTTSSMKGTFSALSPDNGHVLYASDTFGGTCRLELADASDGTTIDADLLGGVCGEPAWSPDGTSVAAICNLSSCNWMFDAAHGDLVVADIDGSFEISNQVTALPEGSGPGRPSYPRYSPDSAWIVTSRTTAGSRSTGIGQLWLVDRAGTAPRRLTALGIGNSEGNRDFYPSFAPVTAGGYSWLAFSSRRDYGNRLIGSSVRQIWVSAVGDPAGGVDPSHPPFYLRGQTDCTVNVETDFAAAPP